MQALAILSFVGCVLSIFFLYLGIEGQGYYTFGASLILLLVSLVLSFYETQISTKALNYELSDLEEMGNS